MDKQHNQGAELSPEEKRALLAQRLREKAEQARNEFPLAYGQRGLWFIHQLAPESSAYHIAYTTRLRSALKLPLLKRAFQRVVERHPVLRTTFHQRGDELIQVVHDDQEIAFEQIDASAWDEDELYAQVVRAHQQPFDLSSGPIIRFYLFTKAPNDHVLLFTVHHIAFDGYSTVLILQDIILTYEAEVSGQGLPLPPPPLPYSEFVRRQLEMLASPVGESLKAYWLNQLSGELPTLNLPTDLPRPLIQTYVGSSYPFSFSREQSARLKAFAAAEGTTLYVLMLAIFQILLHRYSGQNDLLIGSPASSRSLDFMNTAGYFVDPIVLRSKTDDQPTFKSFLAQTRKTVLEAIAHQDYPFMLLVEHLSPRNDPSRSPLFQVMFNLQTALRAEAQQHQRENPIELKAEPYPMPHEEGQFDLVFDIMETEGGLSCWLKYNTDLYQGATIARMVGHYQVLLNAALTNPETPLADLPLLSEDERRQLLIEWNNTSASYPQDRCVHHLVEEQVARTPDAIAVIFEDQQLTYDALNRRANQLAAYLRRLGTRPDDRIGLYVERSLDMAVALLGIHKAGAAYVPLDPTYPKDRIAFMLEDAQVALLITQQRLESTPAEHQAQVIRIDADWTAISQEPDSNVESGAAPENLSYVIYTSGSTGKPKGVMIEHRNVVNFFTGMDERIHHQPPGAWLAVTSLSFDISVLEMFWTLARGFKVVIYTDHSREWLPSDDESDTKGDYSVAAQIARHHITHLQCTPSMAAMLLEDTRDGAALGQLQEMIVGGEALPASLAAALCEIVPGNVINMYGPTETTIWSVTHQLGDEADTIPIGRPIANTSIYLLDDRLHPVPLGVAGELYIGGDGVVRGYLNRPELTQERFIPDPFSTRPGARLYCTGDLARYRPDGVLEFLGRIDHQVKIRGYRIELGEIEALLDEHPAVSQSVVIAREDVPGDKYLAAYMIPKSGTIPNVTDIRQYLKVRLPDFMIPSHYVTLDTFPLTPNAKIDRKALPAPQQVRSENMPASNPPATPMEIILADIWQGILQTDEISIYDNFFDLGGHSLQVMRVINHLESATGLKLDPVRLRFETLGQIAAFCETLAANPEPVVREESGLPQKLLSSMKRLVTGRT